MVFGSDRPLWRAFLKIGTQLVLGRERAHFHTWFPGLDLHVPAGPAETGSIVHRGRTVGRLHHPEVLRRRAGADIVIVGSGPSVRENDVSRLPADTAILLNGAINLVPGVIASPLAVAIEDERFVWRHHDAIVRTVAPGTICLLSVGVIRALCELDVHWLAERTVVLIDDVCKPYRRPRRRAEEVAALEYVRTDGKGFGFSLCPAQGVVQGGSVVVSAFQFAVYCRPRAIGFVGIDLANADAPRFYESRGRKAFSGVAAATDRILSSLAAGLPVCAQNGITLRNHSRHSALARIGLDYDPRLAAAS